MADFSASLCQNLSGNTIETERWRKHPSLPPNYVSLQDLKEKRLKEQQEQKEREEREAEEQRKKLELEKSLQTLKTEASNRLPRTYIRQRPNIAEKRGDIPTFERQIDGRGTINEGSQRRNGSKGKMTYKGRNTLTVADPASSVPEIGEEEEVPKPEMVKSAGDRKIGKGLWSVKEDRSVRIAQETEDLETGRRRKEDERSTAEKKVRDKGPRRIGRTTGSRDKEDRTAEVAREIRDLKVADCDEMEKTGGGKEAERTTRKKLNNRLKGTKDRTWTAEITQRKRNAGSADCDKTIENAEDGKEADERSTAGNDFDLGGLKEKISGTLVEDVEKDRVDPAVQIAQKMGEIEVVDCNEGNGKGVGERSVDEMKPGYREWRNERSSGYQRGFGYRRRFDNGRGFGYGRSFGNDISFGHGRGFGHRERRQPEHLMWVKKEGGSSSSGRQQI